MCLNEPGNGRGGLMMMMLISSIIPSFAASLLNIHQLGSFAAAHISHQIYFLPFSLSLSRTQ